MKPFQEIFYITAIVALGSHIRAGPVNSTSLAEDTEEATGREIEQTDNTNDPGTSSPVLNSDKDLETSDSNQETTYVVSKKSELFPERNLSIFKIKTWIQLLNIRKKLVTGGKLRQWISI